MIAKKITGGIFYTETINDSLYLHFYCISPVCRLQNLIATDSQIRVFSSQIRVFRKPQLRGSKVCQYCDNLLLTPQQGYALDKIFTLYVDKPIELIQERLQQYLMQQGFLWFENKNVIDYFIHNKPYLMLCFYGIFYTSLPIKKQLINQKQGLFGIKANLGGYYKLSNKDFKPVQLIMEQSHIILKNIESVLMPPEVILAYVKSVESD